MVIISIDSGIEKTGYAVFDGKNYLTSALIKTAKTASHEVRLAQNYLQLKTTYLQKQPFGLWWAIAKKSIMGDITNFICN